MKAYAGRSNADPPLGGGGFPVSEGYCGEECNFVPCNDGYLYGFFETREHQVHLERLGGNRKDEFIDGVDIVWTAPIEGKDPRVVVGWWRNSRLYRRRQHFVDYASEQHRKDEINMFCVRAEIDDAFLLKPSERNLTLGRGDGWSGQTSWWYAEDTRNVSAKKFVQRVRARLDGQFTPISRARGGRGNKRRAGTAATDPYKKYVREYEATVHPKHDKLQKKFKAFLCKKYSLVKFLDCFRDDLRYALPNQSRIMVEFKPTDTTTLRFAIRTAMGQLLDYRQQQRWKGQQLIVVETAVVNADDLSLAFDNNFGLAWPDDKGGFEMRWP